MDNDELLRFRRLAIDALTAHVNNEEVYQLAQALETTCEGVEDFDSMVDKTTALEEENSMLSGDVRDLNNVVRDIYRVTKSTSSSDVKRLAEIQEICEEADVDLSKIV